MTKPQENLAAIKYHLAQVAARAKRTKGSK